MKNIPEEFQKDYIRTMRKMIGHAPLVMTACGVLIENPNGELLLQRRKDSGLLGLPGGAMEPGETFEEAARREVREETGLLVGELKLVGIYSGPDQILTYPNGDVCCYTGIVFYTTQFMGELLQETNETWEHRFFAKSEIPDTVTSYDRRMVDRWISGEKELVII